MLGYNESFVIAEDATGIVNKVLEFNLPGVDKIPVSDPLLNARAKLTCYEVSRNYLERVGLGKGMDFIVSRYK